jgi:hypothetical protein
MGKMEDVPFNPRSPFLEMGMGVWAYGRMDGMGHSLGGIVARIQAYGNQLAKFRSKAPLIGLRTARLHGHILSSDNTRATCFCGSWLILYRPPASIPYVIRAYMAFLDPAEITIKLGPNTYRRRANKGKHTS